MGMLATAAIKCSDEGGYESSCSSTAIVTPDSRRSWISQDTASTISISTSSSSTIINPYARKPHKANQEEWEAIRRLRCLTGGRVGLDHFRLVRRLGSGDLGNVYLCRLHDPRLSGCHYAMKVVDKEALAFRNKVQRAETEKEILATLDHPFLPTLYAEFDASHYSCLVMEFCPGGDLHVVRQRQPGRRFAISSSRFYAAEILLALEYLHMMGVIYRDLKPENVLVRADGHIMLSDFDLSLKCDVVPKLVRQKATGSNGKSSGAPSCVPPMQPVLSCLLKTAGAKNSRRKSAGSATRANEKVGEDGEDEEDVTPEVFAEPISARSKSFVGTHEYLAPEVISGLGHGSAVDWWTLGIFLYELLYGRTPFKGENNKKTLINIIKQPLRFPTKTMSTTTRRRKGSKEMEEMLRSGNDLISKLLVKNPKKRIGSLRGSVEIKRHEFFKDINWALIRSVKPPEIPLDYFLRSSSSYNNNNNNNNKADRIIQKPRTPKNIIVKNNSTTPTNIPIQFDYF